MVGWNAPTAVTNLTSEHVVLYDIGVRCQTHCIGNIAYGRLRSEGRFFQSHRLGRTDELHIVADFV